MSPAAWNPAYADLMNLTGAGHLSPVRISVLLPSGATSTKFYLDTVPVFLSLNASSAYPGGSAYSYTPDVGLLDLTAPRGAVVNTTSWQNSNGTTEYANSTLYETNVIGAIPSISFGLHIGSALTNASIPGSLILGGYDSARLLSMPITRTFSPTTNPVTVQLVDIALGIVNGTSPFTSAPSGSIPGLLQSSKGEAAGPTSVAPDPSVPYLYLPGATCDAIAQNLPLIYSPDLNLYLWNTSSPSYGPLIASNTFLSFVFNSGISTSNITINAPFTLLSLSLEYPVANISTPYFPCRPYDKPASQTAVVGSPSQQASATTDSRQDGSTWAGFRLGRAFLQAAFLGINWESNTIWLAQAPGPQLPQSTLRPVTIKSHDLTVSPLAGAPTWAETWSQTLGEFDGPPYTAQNINSNVLATAYGTDSNGGLSPGAIGGIIAGAVIGCLLLAGLIAWIVVRQKRRAKRAAGGEGSAGFGSLHGEKLEYYGDGANFKLAPSTGEYELSESNARFESGGQERPAELVDGSNQVHEMPVPASELHNWPLSRGSEDETVQESTSNLLDVKEDGHGHRHETA